MRTATVGNSSIVIRVPGHLGLNNRQGEVSSYLDQELEGVQAGGSAAVSLAGLRGKISPGNLASLVLRHSQRPITISFVEQDTHN